MTHSHSKRIAILGAGISGLSLAWELQKKYGEGVAITLFEKEERAGGLIQTANHCGELFEWGPRSIRGADGEAVFALIEDMGLSLELISARANRRYILHKGKLTPLPASVKEFFTSPLMRPHLKTLVKELFSKKSTKEDESVFDFFARRFSAAMADLFIDPLMKGIFAGDAKNISVRAAFPKLWEREYASGSLVWSGFKSAFKSNPSTKKGIFTLQRGFGSLILALQERVQKNIKFNCPIAKILFHDHKTTLLINEVTHDFDQVISTLPAHALSPLLQGEIKELLEQIPFASVSVVHLGYIEDCNPYLGFGYLVPSQEKEEILGVVFDSSSFPQQNNKVQTRLTVMIAGGKDPAQLKLIARAAVKKHLGLEFKPFIEEVKILKGCIPQYPVGFLDHLKKISRANEAHPSLFLMGSSFTGISVNQLVGASKAFVLNHQLYT